MIVKFNAWHFLCSSRACTRIVCGAWIVAPLLVCAAANAAVTSIAAGNDHTCAVVDGGVQCWGDNYVGQLGNNSTVKSHYPVWTIPAGSGAIAIAAGSAYTCAVVSGGVQCWGSNIYGQGGNNSMANNSLVPVQAIPAGSGATAVSAGTTHSCAAVAGGVQCWGENSEGQLGNGVVSATPSRVPVQAIAAGSGATAVASDVHSSCAVVNGGVRCWGANGSGQIGNNTLVPSATPVQTIPASSGATAIGVGGFHSCAVVAGGVRCWGVGFAGELGNGSQSGSLTPVQTIAAGSGATSVATAAHTTCAAINGAVKCWGYNANGQLGNNSQADSLIPVQTSLLTNGATLVSAGGTHSCAIMSNNVHCWGGNSVGQLGDGSDVAHLVPVSVVPANGRGTVTGGASHSCALSRGGVKCAGWNLHGELGNNSMTNSSIPVATQNIPSGATQLAAGDIHTCAVVGGGVKCWGRNFLGALGDNSSNDRLTPVQTIPAASNVGAIAAGSSRTCASVNGGMQCWGGAYLGDGSSTGSLVPVNAIAAGSGVAAIAIGTNHNCALTRYGEVKCWGGCFYGALGFACGGAVLTPTTALPPGAYATDVAAGDGHTCAVVGGGVQCWGRNDFGELGDGTGVTKATPTQIIAANSGVTSIAAGYYHTCALQYGGVKCWGSNNEGQVGNGASADALSPVQIIPAGSGATAVGAGPYHSYAVVNDEVLSWGRNSTGEAGINRVTSVEPLPVRMLDVGGNGYLHVDAGGSVPAPFAFATRIGVGRNVSIDSNPITVAGIASAVPISVAGGQVSINNGAFTSTPGLVGSGSTVIARVTSASTYDSLMTANVTIGGRASSFQVRTRSDPAATSVSPALALGENFSLLLLGSGVVLATGNNSAGQLGNGSTLSAGRFGAVAGLSGIRRISAGAKHALALDAFGNVWTWGYNSVGQLGTGSMEAPGEGSGVPLVINSGYPLQANINGVDAIAAGRHHSLARRTDGTVWSWGFNGSGQLGGDCGAFRRAFPAQIAGLSNISAIATGAHHSFAIAANGSLWAWGANDKGQLGDGTTVSKCTPVQLVGVANVIDVAAGDAHTLALTRSGALYAWGANARGQLGDGTTVDKSAPVLIGTGFTGIAAGALHGFALKSGGLAFAWGANDFGQLGEGTLIDRTAPTALDGQSGYVSMAGGARHSGAITRFGEALLWGDNSDGQLGNRTGILLPGTDPIRGVITTQSYAGPAGTSLQRPSQTGANRLILRDMDYFEGDFGAHPLNEVTTRTYVFANEDTPVVGADITGLNISLSGAGFSLSGNTCPGVLSAGSNCTFDISFQPPAPGETTGAISIASNTAGTSEPYTVLGTGIAPATAVMTLSDKFLLYASRRINTTSEAAGLTITNTGNAALTSLMLSSNLADFVATHNCPASLAVNAQCTVNVTFSPAGEGAREAVLALSSNGGSAAVSLSGTGAQSVADIDPAPFAFTSQSAVPVASTRTSNTVALSGIDAPAPIAVAGGTYSIDGGAFVAHAGTVTNGQAVQVSHISASTAGGMVETTLTVGNQSAKFTSVVAAVPGAPTITSVVAGNQSVTVQFSVPNNGGSAITGYTATGLPGGVMGSCSAPCTSITVTGLTNGTSYTFTVNATNAIGTGTSSAASMPVTPTLVTLTLSGVVSRQMHGALGPFDIPILPGPPFSIEPRMPPTGHRIVFQFNAPINATGMLNVVDKDGMPVGVGYAYPSGNNVIVSLIGVADNNRVTITLSSVNGTGLNATATLGFLVSDVNASGRVSASDIASVKARGGVPVNVNNFRADVNASGTIDAADLLMAKARAGLAPP